jgi:hypothetical protein
VDLEKKLAEIASSEAIAFPERGFQIRAGAEDLITLAGQGNDPSVGPVSRIAQRTPQSCENGVIQGIALLGAVDRYAGDTLLE